MQIVFEDTDLEELITTGRNNKYKKYIRNAKFMKALAIAYNYLRLSERASDLRSISFLHYEQLAGTNGMAPSGSSMVWWSAYSSASSKEGLE